MDENLPNIQISIKLNKMMQKYNNYFSTLPMHLGLFIPSLKTINKSCVSKSMQC